MNDIGPLAAVSVAVGIPGKGIWTGTQQTGSTPLAVDSGTVFHAESTGKVFTAFVILELVEQGTLSLDATIDRWYPSIPRSGSITIRHLLTHSSGIPSFETCPEYVPERCYTPMEKVAWSIKYPYLFEPGKSFSYSNTGYILLGLIAEQATGKNFEDLLTEYVIAPLGLRNTFPITNENKNAVIRIPGCSHGQPIASQEDFTGPSYAGPIASTPTDIVLFFQALMSGQLISPQSVQEMFTDMMSFPGTDFPAFYGKGIMALPDVPPSQFPSDLLIEHNGGSSWMGFYSYPVLVP